jgi:hypothetical protein
VRRSCPQSPSPTRAALAAEPFASFDVANRGRYGHSRVSVPRGVLDALTGLSSACVGGGVRLASHRWYRFRRGDYSLCRDDAAWIPGGIAGALDLTLDLSTCATGEAEVVFTHRGQAFFTVPQRPGEVGLVERGPTIERYDRYLTHRTGTQVVERLRLLLTRER